ncbi:MAG: hypothetical protein KatS3mg086_132 [Candidatus Dojkabacteria bacterium]|nr:MAG: hypothetical protein KatS3mg086_132 [Candidatus Dojkabacteria bacterium]
MNNNNLEKIYYSYAQDVYRFALFLCKNVEEAKDITSETFSRYLSKAKSVSSGKEKSWLLATAKNVYRETFRKHPKNKSSITEELNYIPDQTNIEKSFEEEQIQKTLHQELDKLPETTKEIIILKNWYDLKFSEIAEILQMKESAVKQRYYRGLDELKVNLKKTIQIRSLSVASVISSLKLWEYYQLPTFELERIYNSILSFNFLSMGTIASLFKVSSPKLATLAVVGLTTGTLALGGTYYYSTQIENEEESVEKTTEINATCEYNGKQYSDGESFELDNSCTVCNCSEGVVVCDTSMCEEKSVDNTLDVSSSLFTFNEFNIKLSYDQTLGTAQSEIRNMNIDKDGLNCDYETVKFSNDPKLSLVAIAGMGECLGAGAPIENYETAKSVDGTEFIVYETYSDLTKEYGVTSSKGSYGYIDHRGEKKGFLVRVSAEKLTQEEVSSYISKVKKLISGLEVLESPIRNLFYFNQFSGGLYYDKNLGEVNSEVKKLTMERDGLNCTFETLKFQNDQNIEVKLAAGMGECRGAYYVPDDAEYVTTIDGRDLAVFVDYSDVTNKYNISAVGGGGSTAAFRYSIHAETQNENEVEKYREIVKDLAQNTEFWN